MFPYFPTAHAPPGNKATPLSSLEGGNARLFSVFQLAPFHSATRGLERSVFPVLPTATALPFGRAATSDNSPGTDGMSVPAAGTLVVGTVAHAMSAAGDDAAEGDEAGSDAEQAAVAAATATIPARRRLFLACFVCLMLFTS